jgi:hypothetical protein|tara:strand:+ start:462 stop:692 length:231 start_codon:yes stop_codon:yes gene_type:complete
MPKFPKNTSPAMYKSSGFKMKNSALHNKKTKMLKGTTIFGKELSSIKDTAKKFHNKVISTIAGPGNYIVNKIKKKK